MTSIDDVDLDGYCGRIANLYIRRSLSPPFTLKHVAADWKVNGIALSHVVAVIDRHLTDYRNRYYCGSGDALFDWLDDFVRTTWYERQVSPRRVPSSRLTIQRLADHQWLDRQPGAYHDLDPTSPSSREALAGTQLGPPACRVANQPLPQNAEPIGPDGKRPRRIDQAIAFLRRELADGEVAAALLEEKAKASNLSPRTLDRAHARLNVTCRRTGFAKSGKSWLSLPMTPQRTL
jgi:hypothetical protein